MASPERPRAVPRASRERPERVPERPGSDPGRPEPSEIDFRPQFWSPGSLFGVVFRVFLGRSYARCRDVRSALQVKVLSLYAHFFWKKWYILFFFLFLAFGFIFSFRFLLSF